MLTRPKALMSVAMALLAQVTTVQGQCGPTWLDRGGISGVNGVVYCSTVWDPDGAGPKPPMLVLGGSFSGAGTRDISNIVAWDGSEFRALPGGNLSNTVRALAVYNGDLYAGGFFLGAPSLPSTPLKYIARNDGTGWSPVGEGVGSVVYALTVANNELVVGGSFTNVADFSAIANRVVRWNGATWLPMNLGVNQTVYSLFTQGANVVAGGDFTQADGASAGRVAMWDGAGWHAIGTGMNNTVLALAETGGQLIAGGRFTTADGNTANRLAAWNGTAWSQFGGGVGNTVDALGVQNGALIVGGNFTTAGAASINRVATWNGSAWTGFGSGQSLEVFCLSSYNGELYVGGNILDIAGGGGRGVERWDGTQWRSLTLGLNASVNDALVWNNKLIIAGAFTTVPRGFASRVASFDGDTWTDLGPGFVGGVAKLAIYNGDLIAAGLFQPSGGSSAYYVARWNGTSWTPLGAGFDNEIRAMAVYGGKVYVGGTFSNVGSTPVNKIAVWNGSSWASIGAGPTLASSPRIQSLFVYNNRLFIGGTFTKFNGVNISGLARWDGTVATDIGAQISSTVYGLGTDGVDLLVGGDFSVAGGLQARCAAKWSSSLGWRPLPGIDNDGQSYSVNSFGMLDGDVLIGGTFNFGNQASYSLARVTSGGWTGFGSATPAIVNALTTYQGQLFVANASSASSEPTTRFLGRWGGDGSPVVAIDPVSTGGGMGSNLRLEARSTQGVSNVSYQWTRDGVAIAEGAGGASPGGGTIVGASGTLASPTTGDPVALEINDARQSDSGLYRVVFTNTCGTATSDAAAVAVSCPADFNGDGFLDFTDFDAFVSAFESGLPSADFNNDGFVDFTDFDSFVTGLEAGC